MQLEISYKYWTVGLGPRIYTKQFKNTLQSMYGISFYCFLLCLDLEVCMGPAWPEARTQPAHESDFSNGPAGLQKQEDE